MSALDRNARNRVDLPDGRSVTIAYWAEGAIPGLAGWLAVGRGGPLRPRFRGRVERALPDPCGGAGGCEGGEEGMSGRPRQFKAAMALLRACADVGGDPQPGPLPRHLRASARLDLWVERQMRFAKAPRHVREDIAREVERARDHFRAVTRARGDKA